MAWCSSCSAELDVHPSAAPNYLLCDVCVKEMSVIDLRATEAATAGVIRAGATPVAS